MLRAFRRRPMNGYNFTERVRLALARAREEAARLHHEYVGTEHILLGLLNDDGGAALVVLENLGVKPNEVALRIESVVKGGQRAQRTADLPYTSRAKKVLELAMNEAAALGHAYVGTEHLLLGLVREEKGIAAQVLLDSGITLDIAREETLRVIGGAATDKPRIVTRAGGGVAAMRALTDREGAPGSGSATMAASIIEMMARDSGINAVFVAQGIDVARLVEALRAFMPPAPPAESPPAA